MTFNNFKNYVRDKCNYETIYDDGEGRVILVITLLDAYTMTHRAPKDWVGLTDEEINSIDFPESGTATMRDFVRIIEAKLKEKNCG
jgi:hypothetical protein